MNYEQGAHVKGRRAVSERKHTPRMCPSCCFPHLLRVLAHQRLIRRCFLLLERSVVRHSSPASRRVRCHFSTLFHLQNLKNHLGFLFLSVHICIYKNFGACDLGCCVRYGPIKPVAHPWLRSHGIPPSGVSAAAWCAWNIRRGAPAACA